MGILVDGKWRDEDLPQETGKAGNFQRIDSVFRDRVTADGSSGFKAEAGRYHLYVAYTCPWAHRTQIYLRAEEAHRRDQRGASPFPACARKAGRSRTMPAFPDCPPDRVNGFHYLHQAYSASNPHYTGKVTVPTLWDKKTKRIVNNESSEIIRMLNSEFAGIGADPTDFYPPPSARRDRSHQRRRSMPTSTTASIAAASRARRPPTTKPTMRCSPRSTRSRRGSARQRYLVGNQITEADWRLFPTLVRFDVAYFSLFKCNRKRIADYPNLLNYMRELYAVPGVAETVKPRYYVMGYYSITRVNPTGIIPKGTPVDLPAAARPRPFCGVRDGRLIRKHAGVMMRTTGFEIADHHALTAAMHRHRAYRDRE